jgi:hypothetical protein
VDKATVVTTEDTRIVEVDVSPRVCHALPFKRREV